MPKQGDALLTGGVSISLREYGNLLSGQGQYLSNFPSEQVLQSLCATPYMFFTYSVFEFCLAD